MRKDLLPILSGSLLDDRTTLSLAELSRACTVTAERVIELVEEGILEPQGSEPLHWRFPGSSLRRARTALHLQRDLDINLPGVALALELLDELERLRCELMRLGP
ncbi:chaperone modulator CbpM [Geoalkalibacter subterraneus]|jgi:chaperone modulatory protein CbpM|uniref:MerR family transcriptional regulator n=1 Tax=Geoalkalibacter subterraneus TaxID=483547 RepID=A0A0B5FLD1_9BACT|nr:chaperone modulator CbpM [Geoalkalibacter subterraneus]AJF05459.1 MerR family transcriptional regulator [Geoalkalibacter subterraneus]